MVLFAATVVRSEAIICKIVTAYVFCCYCWDRVFGTKAAEAPKHIHSPTELNGTGGGMSFIRDKLQEFYIITRFHVVRRLRMQGTYLPSILHTPKHLHDVVLTQGIVCTFVTTKTPMIWGQGCSALVQ